MNRIFFNALLGLTLGAISISAARAQAAPGSGVLQGRAAPTQAPRGVQILEVNDANISSLQSLSGQGRANAVSLGVSRAKLQADGASFIALAGWVRDGGVVFLHTDAAQLFGYETIAARAGNARMAGQLYGRAKAAIPFGGHPLLWSGGAASTGLPPLGANAGLPEMGVQTVYYQMNEGDHLVVGHAAGTPLLRVTDLALTTNQTLYAAAIAPYGSGWAVFTPRLVEQGRGEGTTFTQNLTRLASGAGATPFDLPLGQAAPQRATSEPFVGLPATLIERATQVADGNGDYLALATEWAKATAPLAPAAFSKPEEIMGAATGPRLMVTKSEANIVAAALGESARGGAKTRFRTLIFVLRARLELQRSDLVSARTWLESANALSPNAAEVLLWQGVWSAASAQEVTLDSPTRARLLVDAVQDWNSAQTATPLSRTGSTPGAGASAATISGVPISTLQTWNAAATRMGELALVEPPLVTLIGGANRVVLLRHFAEDPTLRTALPTGVLLARADNLLGWNVEAEEILIFPNDQYYAAYSQAARIGSRQVAFSPLSNRGNAIDSRILIVSQITVPVLLSPGPPPIYAPLGASVPAVIARLHAQVLLNAATQDGDSAPEWMQLGLMSISNIAVASTLGNNQPLPDALIKTDTVGGLLSPQQFQNVNIGNDQAGIIEAQARRMMIFFYNRFGAGAVVETLQRIGAGEDTDEALRATTNLSEEEFFIAWRNAEFGNRPRGF